MSIIIGIYGLQGWGKTALTTYLGLRAKSNGIPVFSNYPLKKINFTYIETVKDAQNIRNGIALFDEFWEWCHARTSQSKINKLLMEICLLNRKRGVSIVYNSQLPRTIDVILKDVTNYRYLPQMVEHTDGKKYIHYITRDLLGNYSEENIVPFPIEVIGKYFDTRAEVKKPSNELTPLEQAIQEEEPNFIKAISKHLDYQDHFHIPNSGNGSSWGCDIIVVSKHKKYLGIDVKGSNGKRIWYDTSKKEQLKRIRSLINKGATPYLAFPNKKYKRKTILNAWYMYKLHNESSILGRKNPTITKTILNESILLNELQRF